MEGPKANMVTTKILPKSSKLIIMQVNNVTELIIEWKLNGQVIDV